MANLIFKGHATRGKELHKLLEHLGGVDAGYEKCDCVSCFYYINREGFIEGSNMIPNYMTHRMIMSLETFESQYPYKVGDKVTDMNDLPGTITAMSWDECNCTVKYVLKYEGSSISHHEYTALMLNPVKEELIKQPILTPTLDLATGEILYFTDKTTNKKYYPNEPSDLSMECPDGFEFIDENGNVLASKKIKLERKKPQYPKTYEECCELLFPSSIALGKVLTSGYNCELLKKFGELLICRDAYWKIAVDWKYDVNKTEEYFYIVNKCDRVVKEHYMNFNHILAFPTEEMRDNFYENFKELIESCKELL